MATRTRPAIFWIRFLHRWLSMTFIVAAVFLIFPILPSGSVANVVSIIAFATLALLALTGIWEAVHHYTVKFRAPRRARARRTRVSTPA